MFYTRNNTYHMTGITISFFYMRTTGIIFIEHQQSTACPGSPGKWLPGLPQCGKAEPIRTPQYLLLVSKTRKTGSVGYSLWLVSQCLTLTPWLIAMVGQLSLRRLPLSPRRQMPCVAESMPDREMQLQSAATRFKVGVIMNSLKCGIHWRYYTILHCRG